MENFVQKIWSNSIKSKLIISFALIYFIIITVFIFTLVNKQNEFLYNEALDKTLNRTQMLASNSISWVLANDYIGLEEVIQSILVYKDLEFAMIIDPQGKIIAHSDCTFTGKYLADKLSLSIFKEPLKKHILLNNDKFIDVAIPIMRDKQFIAFARVKLNQSERIKSIQIVINQGVFYMILSMLIAILVAYLMGSALTKKLYKLIKLTDEVRSGKRVIQIDDLGSDEIGKLAFAFNKMLQELNESEQELKVANESLELKVKERTIELLKAKDKAESANRAKSIFLANMSHELRTPLNAILGFSQIMVNDSKVTETQRENLNIIERSGSHLLSLINDVLDMSKIEAGRMELQEESVNLYQLLIEISQMMKVRAESKDLSFTMEFHSDLIEFVKVDIGKLRQILINIIGNAIKYTNDGGVSFRVESHEEKNSETYNIIFEVEDSGRGMSESEIKNIFDPFVQVGSSKGVTEGTGLGLAITHNFIKLMNGGIDVESKLNVGTLFKFWLTLNPANPTEIKRVEKRKVVGLINKDRIYRILVVEDQKENRLLLKSILTPIGFEVYEANNGQEGVKEFARIKPDFVWMDIRMPIMNGYEATKKIRKNDKITPIVALTASAFQEQKVEILEAGCNELIHKPYRQEEIFETISKFLGIEFIYEDINNKENGSLITRLSTKDINKIPKDLKEELIDNLINLDTEKIIAIIEKINNIDSKVAGSIIKLAENYEYDKLLEILE